MPTASQLSVYIENLDVSAYTVPTDFPEADGTYHWDKTTIVVVEAGGGGKRGLGYTYASVSTAHLIEEKLFEVVRGRDAMDTAGAWAAMVSNIRNLGRPGICSMAIAAVDSALWDLKARLLNLPLAKLLGGAHESVLAYGSGGFTSYPIRRLQEQLADWVLQGFSSVKMKIGTHPEQDLERVRAAREAVGPGVNLYVDANGAYSRKQALEKAHEFVDFNVTWFEEPVPSDDLEGLRLIRDHAPPGVRIAAGEYGYDLRYFGRMLDSGAVDVMQVDGTRCGGVTEFMRAAALCAAHSVPLSAHTAPSLHTHLCCAALPAYNIEYFHDHVRIEEMLFEGAIKAQGGVLRPDLSRPGLGLELKRQQAARYAVYGMKTSGGKQ